MLSADQESKPRLAAARYGVAVGCVVAGWVAREGITPAVGVTALPFIFFFPAVAMAAWYGGLGPGALATVLSAVLAGWFFIEPLHSFSLSSSHDITALAAFVFSSLFIVGAMEAMHRANARAQAAALNNRRQKELLAITLASIGDAVIVTDVQGRVTFVNEEARKLTGWTDAEAALRPLLEVFRIVNEQTRQPVENPVEKVLRLGTVVGLANHTILLSRDGREVPIDDSAAPIRQPDGTMSGVVLVFRDVTEQRRAQRTKAQLAAIVEFSGDAIFTKNLDGTIQTWNASAERIFGYRPEEIIGKPVTVLIPKDRWEEEEFILGRLRQGLPAERLETVRVAKDGRQIPVSLSVSPLRDAEGDVVGASKVIHDISELVAAREAVIREKELLATTLASIGDGVIVTDAEGRVKFLNGEAEKLTGWKPSDAAGRPLPEVFRIVNEQTRQTVESPVEKVLRLGTVVGLANHTILIAKDGREIPIDDSGAPIRQPGGQLFGVVLVFRDFTEHKETQARLRDLALLPAQNPAPVLRIARDGALLHANPAALKILQEWNLEVGSAAPALLSSAAKAALAAMQATECELAVGERIFLFAVAPIPEADYANLYGTNVTERKRAEVALQAANEQLKRREASLAHAVQVAQEATKAKDEFLAIVSHELRTPLTAMLGWVRLIQGGNMDAGKVSRGLSVVERNINVQTQLIEDLLDISRIVTGKMNLNIRPSNLEKIIAAAIESVRPAADARGIQIRADLEPIWTPVDSDRLQQVVWNLLTNAIKFSNTGGEVSIQSRQMGPQVRIVVSDNGKGIAPEFLPQLFNRFTQEDTSTTRQHGGLGLGLAIAKHLVEAHGGRIGAESGGDGRGATFTIELPSPVLPADPLKEVPVLIAPQGRSNLTGVRVLAVDDEADARELLIAIINQHGGIPHTAPSAPAALSALGDFRPDVLITDIGMAGMDGYTFIRKVRGMEDESLKRVPAIALTAYARDEDRRQALEAGFQAHEAKPIEPDRLVALIARLAKP
jgi:PAS domain S-box-containing protein